MDALRATSIILALVTTGLMAGFYAAFSHTVMPGLARASDRTFVPAFQAIDRAVMNPWFMAGGFVGALVTGLAAVLTSLGDDALALTVPAAALYVTSAVITSVVNVPLNNRIQAAGSPEHADELGAVRAEFDERRWNRWNHVRAFVCTGAVALYGGALLVTG